MLNKENHTESHWNEGESLTYDKLAAMLDALPKIEFSALTVNPAFEQVLLHHPDIKKRESENNSLTSFPRACFAELNVYRVGRQIENCIEWKSKDSLDSYLEMMGERETTQTERIDAINKIAQLSGLDYGKVVLETMGLDADILSKLVQFFRPPEIELDAAKFSKELEKFFVEPVDVPKTKDRTQSAQPFYSKFIGRRKR